MSGGVARKIGQAALRRVRVLVMRPDRHQPRIRFDAHSVATAFALAGAGVLVYWTSTSRPMWVDEEMLALNVRDRSFLQLAGPLWLDQSAPLGWLALQRLILLVFGTSEPAVRLLTTLFGAATLFTARWIGRRWLSALGAAILVALCATGEWIVFFTLEAKHYSADTCFALLVPALAVWALDGADRDAVMQRVRRWWLAAAATLWFSNGALFVTPASALVLCALVGRRYGARDAVAAALGGMVWILSLAACYFFVLRHALANAYLRNYWAFAFPPVSSGIGATLRWTVSQLAPFAIKPIGAGKWQLFWVAWLCGTSAALVSRRAIGPLFGAVPLSAIVLALLHIVPTFERIALWVVPATYVAVALCADAAVAVLRARNHLAWRAPVAAILAFIGLAVAFDVVSRGMPALEHRPRSNYGLDDRSSVRWLLANRRPGDVVLTTHYGLAAIWWYARVNVSNREASARLDDGTPLYEIGYAEEDCAGHRQALDDVLRGRSRIVTYLGFRLNVEPRGFDRFVLAELAKRGAVASYKEYVEESRLAAFDLSRPPSSRATVESLMPPLPDVPPLTSGCLAVRPGLRW